MNSNDKAVALPQVDWTLHFPLKKTRLMALFLIIISEPDPYTRRCSNVVHHNAFIKITITTIPDISALAP